MMAESELDKNTRFGPAVESFFSACLRGKQKYGDNGGVLNKTRQLEIKTKMYYCVSFMLENLSKRFPKEDLYVYKLLRVVDPRPRRRPKLDTMAHADCVKDLLHIFEAMQSRSVFLVSQMLETWYYNVLP